MVKERERERVVETNKSVLNEASKTSFVNKPNNKKIILINKGRERESERKREREGGREPYR